MNHEPRALIITYIKFNLCVRAHLKFQMNITSIKGEVLKARRDKKIKSVLWSRQDSSTQE